ncbi:MULTISPECIES: hypothetical protein [unclassified Exiguobacterium]|nr:MULTISPECIES: hypothetical protein [unclassified Exiguobacterium]MCQ4089457.1 hypothetical protein [Exiguobacterium sp. LL15]NTY10349.1 hypothetical protein [Exiguobacterium sp. JMULE1]
MKFLEQDKKLVILHDARVVELLHKFPASEDEFVAYIKGAKKIGNRNALRVVERLILVNGIHTKKTALTYRAAMALYSDSLELIGIEVEHLIDEGDRT